MKNILISAAAILSAVASIHGGAARVVPAVVCEVFGDLVTAADYSGEAWSFSGSGFCNGQRVRLVMSDCGTPSIYDDFIIYVF